MDQPKQADVESVVAAFIDANRREGYHPLSEASMVLKSAAEFSGWKYRITRELIPGWVDCSTLVSQAHWNGAGIGIPFVAETQRRAYSATTIRSNQRAPSDVLVRYPSKEMAPDGRHNHVVLYLGRHPQLGEWVIESAPHANGVQVRPLQDVDMIGGVRRFLPFPRRFTFPAQEVALKLARSVPKLGRIGARLTSGLTTPRRHAGIDLYAEDAFAVLAPVGGSIVRKAFRGQRHMGEVRITHPSEDLAVTLRGLDWSSLRESNAIEVSDVIGICRRHSAGICNSIPALRGYPKLHLEMWSRQRLPFSEERGLAPPDRRNDFPTVKPFNPIYAIKLGVIGSPIRSSDTEVLVAVPRSPTSTPAR